MSAIEALAKHVGSRRYARDLIGGSALTRPWWDAPPPVEFKITEPFSSEHIDRAIPAERFGNAYEGKKS
jgi:hypothetical protein